MLLEDLSAIKRYNITNMRAQQNGSSQNPMTKDLGEILRILQQNIEGLSRAKSDYLFKILNQIDVLLLQETHCSDLNQLQSRGNFPGYTLVSATHHSRFGTAPYVKNDLDNLINVELIK